MSGNKRKRQSLYKAIYANGELRDIDSIKPGYAVYEHLGGDTLIPKKDIIGGEVYEYLEGEKLQFTSQRTKVNGFVIRKDNKTKVNIIAYAFGGVVCYDNHILYPHDILNDMVYSCASGIKEIPNVGTALTLAEKNIEVIYVGCGCVYTYGSGNTVISIPKDQISLGQYLDFQNGTLPIPENH